MAKQRVVNKSFPMGGLNKKFDYHRQPSDSSRDMDNVWPGFYEKSGMSRPGLEKSIYHNGSEPAGRVQAINEVRTAQSSGWEVWEEKFFGSSLSSFWTEDAANDASSHTVSDNKLTVDSSLGIQRFYRADDDILGDSAFENSAGIPHYIEAFVAAKDNSLEGEIELYALLSNTSPDPDNIGLYLNLRLSDSVSFSGSVESQGSPLASFNTNPNPGYPQSGWLRLYVIPTSATAGTVQVFWQGQKLWSSPVAYSVSGSNGVRMGFGLDPSSTDMVVGGVRVGYLNPNPVTVDKLVAIVGDSLYYEEQPNFLTVVDSTNFSEFLNYETADFRQKLYIADHGVVDGYSNLSTGTLGASGTKLIDATKNFSTDRITHDEHVLVLRAGQGSSIREGSYSIREVAATEITFSPPVQGISVSGGDSIFYDIVRAPKVFDPGNRLSDDFTELLDSFGTFESDGLRLYDNSISNWTDYNDDGDAIIPGTHRIIITPDPDSASIRQGEYDISDAGFRKTIVVGDDGVITENGGVYEFISEGGIDASSTINIGHLQQVVGTDFVDDSAPQSPYSAGDVVYIELETDFAAQVDSYTHSTDESHCFLPRIQGTYGEYTIQCEEFHDGDDGENIFESIIQGDPSGLAVNITALDSSPNSDVSADSYSIKEARSGNLIKLQATDAYVNWDSGTGAYYVFFFHDGVALNLSDAVDKYNLTTDDEIVFSTTGGFNHVSKIDPTATTFLSTGGIKVDNTPLFGSTAFTGTTNPIHSIGDATLQRRGVNYITLNENPFGGATGVVGDGIDFNITYDNGFQYQHIFSVKSISGDAVTNWEAADPASTAMFVGDKFTDRIYLDADASQANVQALTIYEDYVHVIDGNDEVAESYYNILWTQDAPNTNYETSAQSGTMGTNGKSISSATTAMTGFNSEGGDILELVSGTGLTLGFYCIDSFDDGANTIELTTSAGTIGVPTAITFKVHSKYIAVDADLKPSTTSGVTTDVDFEVFTGNKIILNERSVDGSNITPVNSSGVTGFKIYRNAYLTINAPDGVKDPEIAFAGGSVAYKIIDRSQTVLNKVFPLIAETDNLGNVAGSVPVNYELVTTFQDCLVWARSVTESPHSWIFSRRGNPRDYDFSLFPEDPEAAVFSDVYEGGRIGEPINALIPFTDNLLLFGCDQSIYMLHGHPGAGGFLAPVSMSEGIVGPNAWCHVPGAGIVFMSTDGLYYLGPGGSSYPVPVSQGKLPQELSYIPSKYFDVDLVYDYIHRGVHIFISAKQIGSSATTNTHNHFFMDWETKSFYPMSFNSTVGGCSPSKVYLRDDVVLVGGQDGVIRSFNRFNIRDAGGHIAGHYKIGPIILGDVYRAGRLDRVHTRLGSGSGDVTVNVRTDHIPELSLDSRVIETGTATATGTNMLRPRTRGTAATVELAFDTSTDADFKPDSV